MVESELPPPPISEMVAAFMNIHELFKAWMSAGFTEDQALKLLVMWMQEQAKQQ